MRPSREATCCICFDNPLSTEEDGWVGHIAKGSTVDTPGTNHLFHKDCIDRWITAHSNCPVCRENLEPVYRNEENPNE